MKILELKNINEIRNAIDTTLKSKLGTNLEINSFPVLTYSIFDRTNAKTKKNIELRCLI